MDSARYGTPPAPPPLSAGSLPSQRLSTQIPQYNVAEAPACVQNAMMTKDKKPFTYTPGGIDLSQIKSQRMAKRLARNAQSEGTTGQQQMHRPTTQLPSQQQHQSNGASAPAAAQLGATAMGMPFQVLPTGPPPPPPQPGKVGAPPPPPPAPQNKLAPQSNGNAPRRSPTPQNFEPPPMGFRPEIKIPPNPMASLKKVPPPQEKNNFWMEEYRKERSKSPMVGNDENDNNYRSSPPNNPQPETNQYSYTNNNNNNQQQNDYQQPQQTQYRAPQSPQPMRQQQQQEFYNQNQPSPPRTPVQQKRIESPYQTQQYSQQQQQSPTIQRQTSHQYAPPPSPQYLQQQQQNSPQQSSPTIQRQQSQQQQYQNSPQHSPQIQRQQSIPTQPQQQQQYHQNSPQPQQSPSIQRQQTVPQSSQYQSPTSPQYQQQQQQQSSPTQQQQSVPWRQQKQVPLGIQNNVSRPRDVMSPAPAESPRPQPQQQQQFPPYLRSREALSPAPEQQQQSPQLSQPYQQKNAQVGSIYIPPVVNQQQQQQQYSPYQDAQGSRQQQQQTPRQAPTNRWMNAQGQPVENQTISRIKSPPPTSSTTPISSNGFAGSHNNAGLRLQINTNTSSSNGKERIIPIQLEQTPTPTRTPSAAPGFGPQPFYNSAQQQQYSSVPSPPMNQGTPNNGQNSPNYVIRSPNQFVDQGYNQYTGVQDHPSRVTSPPMLQQQQSRIIQQTSTAGGIKTRIIPIAVESQPDGPLNPNNARGPISQQPIVIQNDPRNQNTWGNGGGGASATPTQSKSFRILQKITDTSDDSALENKAIDSDGGSVSGSQEHHEPQLQRPSFARQMTSTGQINSPNNVEQMKRMQLNNNEQQQVYANRARNQGTPPVMKQPQPNRYVSQRPVYSPDEHSQQYVHPSEQQVPEPKIYTGSAIPSRSFKILQAMTTPENAGPGQSDL